MKNFLKEKFGLLFILFTIIIVIGVPICTLFIISDGHPYDMYTVNKAVPQHLTQLGYSEDDFYETRYVTEANLANDDYYNGCYSVIFNDEPTITYYYCVAKHKKTVKQIIEKDEQLTDGSYIVNSNNCLHSEAHCVKTDSAK